MKRTGARQRPLLLQTQIISDDRMPIDPVPEMEIGPAECIGNLFADGPFVCGDRDRALLHRHWNRLCCFHGGQVTGFWS